MGNALHLELTWGTPSCFAFLRCQQCSSRLVTVFLGTLWCSTKHTEAPYVFVWEKCLTLHPMQGIRSSSPAEGYV